jgi:hypothetical protein
MAQSYPHTAAASEDILSLEDDGFSVKNNGGGANSPANEDGGEGFDWFAFAADMPQFGQIAHWVGDGGASDARQITIDGFDSVACVLAKNMTNTSSVGTYIKTATMVAAQSKTLINTAVASSYIRAFGEGYFNLGSNLNLDARDYVALVLAESNPEPIRYRRIRKQNQHWLECSSGGVLLPEDETLNLTGSQTWEFLVRPGFLAHTSTEHIFTRALDAANIQAGMYISSDAIAKMVVYQNSASTIWRMGQIMYARRPEVISYSWDADTDNQRLYRNGNLVRECYGTGAVNVTDAFSITSRGATYRVAFGGINDGGTFSSGGNYSFGSARVYDRCLSPGEMMGRAKDLLFNLGDPASDFLEEWKFSEGTGSTVAATNNSALNGVITNGVWKPRYLDRG